MTENLDRRRLDLVRAAQQQWIAALTDPGGRNTLMARWDELFLEPAAPVLLRGLTRRAASPATRLRACPARAGRHDGASSRL